MLNPTIGTEQLEKIRDDWLSIFELKDHDGKPIAKKDMLDSGSYFYSIKCDGGTELSLVAYTTLENEEGDVAEMTEILCISNLNVEEIQYDSVSMYLHATGLSGIVYSKEMPLSKLDKVLAIEAVQNIIIPDSMWNSSKSIIVDGKEKIVFNFESVNSSCTKILTLEGGRQHIEGIYTPYSTTEVLLAERSGQYMFVVKVDQSLVVRYIKPIRGATAAGIVNDPATSFGVMIGSPFGLRLKSVQGFVKIN